LAAYPGPVITRYEIEPAVGVKGSQIINLAKDLARALSVISIRVVETIPGKSCMGLELPNPHRQTVRLSDILSSQAYHDLHTPLTIALGKDIAGNPVVNDLGRMPHLLVAGTTGSGKSVAINAMILSLLYKAEARHVRLILVDPKMLELSVYQGIPHLLAPVVTDMKQAANALKWAVDEMERRYQLFANAGTKNIATYNGWVDRVRQGLAKAPKPKEVTAIAPNGDTVAVPPAEDGSDAPMPERIAYIVIVVDEFSDLMMQQGKDVEAAVARLAQKARAAGMHVILATQRPSVDVITGVIKANFPTRIAFHVSQKVDSRTILDEQGAEHLLGKGDMLVKIHSEIRRVQGPFVSEEEVQRVTEFLRKQGSPVYDENILRPRDDETAGADGDAEQDPLYDEAVRIVADTRRCSTSWLQRKLNLGYNRAARIVEMMEKRCLVGPPNGAKEREVLIGSI
jgi:S-DNA-T family DNA segregation ATPase FtsK/SpoIIIE